MSMGERDKARVGYDFAQSLLEDLNSGTSRKAFKKGYDIARCYSKALNDAMLKAMSRNSTPYGDTPEAVNAPIYTFGGVQKQNREGRTNFNGSVDARAKQNIKDHKWLF